MDAVTSFELEAQRRRETAASDRVRPANGRESTETVAARIIEPRGRTALPIPPGDCQSGPLARQVVG